jgi:signal transduction histidine kinase
MELRQDVYRVFKEMLQNVLRHARATHVEIALRYARGKLVVTVADNGVGFVESDTKMGNGLGLMRGRAERHGGAFDIVSTRTSGTSVTLEVGV